MAEKEKTRTQIWSAIEARVFAGCIYQMYGKSGRYMLEMLVHKKTGRPMLVEKTYTGTVPPRGGKPWPELSAVVVFDQVAPQINEWDKFEQVLSDLQ